MLKFVDENDRVVEQRVQYEWEPVLCSKCNMFGHEDIFCKGQQQGKKVWVLKPKPTNGKENVTKATVNSNGEVMKTAHQKHRKEIDTIVEVISVDSTGLDQLASSSNEDNGGSGEAQRRVEELIDKGIAPQ